MYREFFHFPSVRLRRGARTCWRWRWASARSRPLAGRAATVVRVARLPPAEAMRPESPPVYRAHALRAPGRGRLAQPRGAHGGARAGAPAAAALRQRAGHRARGRPSSWTAASAWTRSDYLMELQFERCSARTSRSPSSSRCRRAHCASWSSCPACASPRACGRCRCAFAPGTAATRRPSRASAPRAPCAACWSRGAGRCPLPPEGLLLGERAGKAARGAGRRRGGAGGCSRGSAGTCSRAGGRGGGGAGGGLRVHGPRARSPGCWGRSSA